MPEQIKNGLWESEKNRMSVLIKIDRYLRRTAMSATRFGRLAVRDPRLVHDLRRGRQPGAGMIARIDAFIDDGALTDEGARS